ncbi:MAG: AAA family ATPase [Nitrospiraceae bacterium]|nr:MAG: AAA family ATPase [Nitrospiraceae bacterium]
MYENHWHCDAKPFENTPDPDYFYCSPKHEEALSRLLYAVKERKGGVMLTGEPGCGKTLLSRVLLKELNSDMYQFAIIFNPRLSPLNLLQEIVYQLDGDSRHSSKIRVLRAFDDILRANRNRKRSTVIVVDEAQAITHKNCFEELRLLLNFQSNDDFLLTLVLLGQPELKSRINDLPQLKQRLTVRYHLNALSEDETSAYIQHRLKSAGIHHQIFSGEACREIYYLSGGVPRRINNICDMALLVGAAHGTGEIDQKIVGDVAVDLEEVPV